MTMHIDWMNANIFGLLLGWLLLCTLTAAALSFGWHFSNPVSSTCPGDDHAAHLQGSRFFVGVAPRLWSQMKLARSMAGVVNPAVKSAESICPTRNGMHTLLKTTQSFPLPLGIGIDLVHLRPMGITCTVSQAHGFSAPPPGRGGRNPRHFNPYLGNLHV